MKILLHDVCPFVDNQIFADHESPRVHHVDRKMSTDRRQKSSEALMHFLLSRDGCTTFSWKKCYPFSPEEGSVLLFHELTADIWLPAVAVYQTFWSDGFSFDVLKGEGAAGIRRHEVWIRRRVSRVSEGETDCWLLNTRRSRHVFRLRLDSNHW